MSCSESSCVDGVGFVYLLTAVAACERRISVDNSGV